MKRYRNRIRWILASLSLLLSISVSATGQDTANSSGESARAESLNHSPTVLEAAGSNQPERTPTGLMAANGDPGLKADKTSEDLTGFFAIGFIVNILVIGAFLFWAVGQWRKKR